LAVAPNVPLKDVSSSTEKDVNPTDKVNGFDGSRKVTLLLPPPPPPHELMINNIDKKYSFFIVISISGLKKKEGLEPSLN
jgi:hypothetical protein